MEIYVETIGNGLVLPKAGDAGIDLIAATDGEVQGEGRFIEYGTGVRLAPSSNQFHGFIFPRSSISNYNLSLCNSVGLIDASYRGEIKLRFRILRDVKPCKFYNKGDKIAQIVFLQPVSPQIISVDSFENCDSVRGNKGFGSTGQ